MDDLSKEDREFLDALAGRTRGTAGQQALRQELLYSAQLAREAEAADAQPLSASELEQQERLRAMLVAAGALPGVAADQRRGAAASPPNAEESRGSLWQRLAGLLGLGGVARRDGGAAGATIWGVPVAALASVGLLVVTFWALKPPRPVDDVTRTVRRGVEVEVLTPAPAAKCDEIRGALAGVGVSAVQLSEARLVDGGCAMTVRTDDQTQQQRVKEALARARVEIEAGAKMDFSVVKSP